jgi:hypothetical protein
MRSALSTVLSGRAPGKREVERRANEKAAVREQRKDPAVRDRAQADRPFPEPSPILS